MNNVLTDMKKIFSVIEYSGFEIVDGGVHVDSKHNNMEVDICIPFWEGVKNNADALQNDLYANGYGTQLVVNKKIKDDKIYLTLLVDGKNRYMYKLGE